MTPKSRLILLLGGLLAIYPSGLSQQASGEDSIYSPGNGVSKPTLVHAVPAEYPEDSAQAELPCSRVVIAVIGVNGIPQEVRPHNTHPDKFDEAAIAAVKHSTFSPGSYHRKPVPVVVGLWIPFLAQDKPATPQLLPLAFDKPPIMKLPLAASDSDSAPSSNETSKISLKGTVALSVSIDENGNLSDVHVLRTTESRLNEKAIAAIRIVQFSPALKMGVPIPATIMMESKFDPNPVATR